MTDAAWAAYLRALDAGDLDTLAAFWDAASDNPELAGELAELTAEAAAAQLEDEEIAARNTVTFSAN